MTSFHTSSRDVPSESNFGPLPAVWHILQDCTLIWAVINLHDCVAVQAGGFIASHLAKRLKSEGHYLVCSDWKRNSHMSVSTHHLPFSIRCLSPCSSVAIVPYKLYSFISLCLCKELFS